MINAEKQECRSGFYLSLTTQDKSVFIAEMAPFYEVHPEKLEQAFFKLIQIIPFFPRQIDSLQDIEKFSHQLQVGQIYPSVLFAVEYVLFQIYAHNLNCDVVTLLSNAFLFACTNILEINALIYCGVSMEEMKNLYLKGFRTFKIKLWGDIDKAMNWFCAIKQLPLENLNFRLDANYRWSQQELIRFIKNLPSSIKKQISYIEDPCSQIDDNEFFFEQTQVAYALDIDNKFQNIKTEGLIALVCKPSRYGGIFDFIRLLKWSISQQISLIISSSFESQYGLLNLAQLACISGHAHAHGLGTNLYFAPHKFNSPLQTSHLSREQIAKEQESLKEQIIQHGDKIYEFCVAS